MYGNPVGYGWLPRNVGPRPPLNGCVIEECYPTRWEEYALVAELLARVKPGLVIDAGTGFNPEIHVLPIILARMGWKVRAIDTNPKTLELPASDTIERVVEDLFAIKVGDGEAIAYVSVSTVEHLEDGDRPKVFAEAYRVLAPGGWCIMTADWLTPQELAFHAQSAGFTVEREIPHRGERLIPDVSFLRARKPL